MGATIGPGGSAGEHTAPIGAPGGGPDLRRVIGYWDALALVVGLIIGSGIFRAPASVAEHLPSAPLMMLAWFVGGLLSLAGGLSAAELGVRFPKSGGQYVFLREAFGPSVAFAFGVTTVVISKPSVLAGIATVFALYASGLVGLPPEFQKLLAAGAIVLLTTINCLGVKSGTRTQNLLTLLKTAGLALLGVAAFASGRGDWSHFARAGGALAGAAGGSALGGSLGAAGIAAGVPLSGGLLPAAAPHSLPIALALGLVTILYTYDGWIDVTYTAGEVVRPERVLPRAILTGTFVCTGLYLAANAAYLYLLDPAEMPHYKNVAAVALERAFGHAGGTTLAILVIVSTLGILNGSILTGVRVPFAMGRDGMLFRFLGRVHPRTLSPVNALIAQGAFACVVLLFASGFDEIASLFVSTTWFFYAVSFTGLLVIQWRERRRAAGLPAGESTAPAGPEGALHRSGVRGQAVLRADGGPAEGLAGGGPVAASSLDRLPDRSAADASEREAAGPRLEGAAFDRAPYRMPLSPLPAVLFIVVTLFIIGSDLVFSGPRVLIGMAIVFAAVPLHRICVAFMRGRPLN